MSFFAPNGYLTIDQAIDRVVELNQGDAGPLLTEDEKAILRDLRTRIDRAMRPQPKPVVPVAKADGRNWFTSSKTPTDQTPDTSLEDKPLPNVTREEVRDLRKKEGQLKEQQSAAGEELRQHLFAGRLPSETITKEGSLIETPKQIWGGDQ